MLTIGKLKEATQLFKDMDKMQRECGFIPPVYMKPPTKEEQIYIVMIQEIQDKINKTFTLE